MQNQHKRTRNATSTSNKHIEQVTKQNAILLSLVQEQQKKVEDLIMQSKTFMEAIYKEKTTPEMSDSITQQTR